MKAFNVTTLATKEDVIALAEAFDYINAHEQFYKMVAAEEYNPSNEADHENIQDGIEGIAKHVISVCQNKPLVMAMYEMMFFVTNYSLAELYEMPSDVKMKLKDEYIFPVQAENIQMQGRVLTRGSFVINKESNFNDVAEQQGETPECPKDGTCTDPGCPYHYADPESVLRGRYDEMQRKMQQDWYKNAGAMGSHDMPNVVDDIHPLIFSDPIRSGFAPAFKGIIEDHKESLLSKEELRSLVGRNPALLPDNSDFEGDVGESIQDTVTRSVATNDSYQRSKETAEGGCFRLPGTSRNVKLRACDVKMRVYVQGTIERRLPGGGVVREYSTTTVSPRVIHWLEGDTIMVGGVVYEQCVLSFQTDMGEAALEARINDYKRMLDAKDPSLCIYFDSQLKRLAVANHVNADFVVKVAKLAYGLLDGSVTPTHHVGY